MVSESTLLKQIQLEASRVGARLLRNQVGKYELKDGRWLTSGLAVGSSDLIGWTPVTITPEMIGRAIAVFTAIEVKAPRGVSSEEQRAFVRAVTAAGGLAGFAKSIDQALAILESVKKI